MCITSMLGGALMLSKCKRHSRPVASGSFEAVGSCQACSRKSTLVMSDHGKGGGPGNQETKISASRLL